MEARSVPQPSAGQRRILHQLIQGHGLIEGDYALFFVTGEGRYLPTSTLGDEIEEASGYVLDRQGRVYSFWLGWDAAAKVPSLTEWAPAEPEAHWSRSTEYQRAREQVGLVVS